MQKVLQGLPGVVAYIDDILVTGKMDEEHLQNLDRVLECLLEHNLQLKKKKKKHQLMQSSVKYLGYIVDAQGLRPMPDKVNAITKALWPQNVKKLRSLLGLVGYYRQFIANMSTLTKPSMSSWSRVVSGHGQQNVRML